MSEQNMCNCKGMCANPRMGMFLLRLAVGAIFIYNGYEKFRNMDAVRMFFTSVHLWPWLATLVAAAELIGGAALMLGFWTCFFAPILAIVMIVAIVWTKFGNMSFGAIQLPLVLLAALLTIKHGGAGKWAMGKHCGCMVCKKGE